MFWPMDGTLQLKYTLASEMSNILKGYLDHSQAFPATNLLSRKVIQSIKKARVQQLVNNLFHPLSYRYFSGDFGASSVLWLTAVPQAFDKLTDLVDLLDSVGEILPANYQLVISVCKLLSRTSNSAVV